MVFRSEILFVLPVCIFWLSIITLANKVRAEEASLQLGVVNIEGILEEDKPQLPYNRFLSAIFEDLKLRQQSTYLPHARTHKWLEENRLTCSFPDNMQQLKDPKNYLESVPVNSVQAHLFSLKTAYTNMDQLRDKVVLHMGHYAFDGLLEEFSQSSYVPVDSPSLAFKLLRQGRADAYIEYVPDIFHSLTSDQLRQLKYDLRAPLRVLHDRFLCVKSDFTVELIERINALVEDYHKSGKMAELLGASYGHQRQN